MTQTFAPPEGPAVSGELIAETLHVPLDQLDSFSVGRDQVEDFLEAPGAVLNNLGAIPTRPDIPHPSFEVQGTLQRRTHVEIVPAGQGTEVSVARTIITDAVAGVVFGARRVVRSFHDLSGEFRVEDLGTTPLSSADAVYLCMQARRWHTAYGA